MIFDPRDPRVFAARLKEEFRVVRPTGGHWTLTLEAVDVTIDDETQLCFSLLFRCPEMDMAHGIHALAHAELGEAVLTIGPVRLRNGALRYEAVVNLLRDGANIPFPGSSAGISNPQPR